MNFNTFVNIQFELNIKSFQCDNGGEFDNNMFHQFCTSRGITLHFSCPYTSSQNGKSERKIRSIKNIIRTLLCHASLPPSFWPNALNMATYLLNILPSKLLGNLTPTHLLYHKSPTNTHLGFLGVYVSSSFHLLLSKNSILVPLHVSFWVTRLPIEVTSAMISHPVKSLYLDMFSLMRPFFLFLALIHRLPKPTNSWIILFPFFCSKQPKHIPYPAYAPNWACSHTRPNSKPQFLPLPTFILNWAYFCFQPSYTSPHSYPFLLFSH